MELNFEKEKNTDIKSLIKKFKPIIFVLVLVIVSWFIFLNFYLKKEYSSNFEYDSLYNQQQEMEKIINFLNSDSFNKLVFTPNPAVFNPIPIENISPFLINNNKNPFVINQ
ncbi:MAG: hypothetical protein XD85_0507 [Parcubacteria bacterium 34_609]|nr:MAG: hypothetical protein XD85_0507 [Parcubacteria bacterium 34_609]